MSPILRYLGSIGFVGISEDLQKRITERFSHLVDECRVFTLGDLSTSKASEERLSTLLPYIGVLVVSKDLESRLNSFIEAQKPELAKSGTEDQKARWRWPQVLREDGPDDLLGEIDMIMLARTMKYPEG